MKMRRIHLVIALTLLTVFGSLFMVQASNMFFDDVFNIQVKLTSTTIVVTIPAATIAILFVLATLYVIRLYKHPDCFKRLSITYLINIACLGLIGTVTAIISGAVVYHTMAGSHPFPGYLIIFLIFNVVMLAASIGCIYLLKNRPADEGRIKVTIPYIFKTVGWFLFISLVFNRLGLFIGAPSYIYWRNFYQTFPTYLYLIFPVFLGVLKVFQLLGLFNHKKNLILALVAIGLNVCFFAYTAIMGINDTGFVSSISQLYPLERMAAKPVELPIHFLAYLGVGISLIITNKKPQEEAK